MNSIDQLDDMRSLWQQMATPKAPETAPSDSRQILDFMRHSERRSLVSRLVRRHVVLGVLGVAVIPLDMLYIYLQFGMPGWVTLTLSIYGIFAGCCAFWVAWQSKNLDYGDMTMREAWHKADAFYRRRNMLRNISLCIGIPLVIVMIIVFNDVIGRPAMIGGIVGGIIGGAIGIYQNWRTQQQMRAMRDTFDE